MPEANAANRFFSKNEGLFKGSFSSSVIASTQGLAMARDEIGEVAEVYSMDEVTERKKNFQDLKKMAEKKGHCESETSTESENEPVVEIHVPKRKLRRRGPPPSKGVAKRSRVK